MDDPDLIDFDGNEVYFYGHVPEVHHSYYDQPMDLDYPPVMESLLVDTAYCQPTYASMEAPAVNIVHESGQRRFSSQPGSGCFNLYPLPRRSTPTPPCELPSDETLARAENAGRSRAAFSPPHPSALSECVINMQSSTTLPNIGSQPPLSNPLAHFPHTLPRQYVYPPHVSFAKSTYDGIGDSMMPPSGTMHPVPPLTSNPPHILSQAVLNDDRRRPYRIPNPQPTGHGVSGGMPFQPPSQSTYPQGFASQSTYPQGFAYQPVYPQGFSSRSVYPQGFASQPAYPQGFAYQPVYPQGFSSRSAYPQGSASQSVNPQGFAFPAHQGFVNAGSADSMLAKVRLRLEVSKEIPLFDGEGDPISWMEQSRSKLAFADVTEWGEQLLILESRLLPPMIVWGQNLPSGYKASWETFESALRSRCSGRESDLRLVEERIVYTPEIMSPDAYGQIVQKSVDLKYGYSALDAHKPEVIRVYVAEFVRGLPVPYYDEFQRQKFQSLSQCVEFLRIVRTRRARREFHEMALGGSPKVYAVQAKPEPSADLPEKPSIESTPRMSPPVHVKWGESGPNAGRFSQNRNYNRPPGQQGRGGNGNAGYQRRTDQRFGAPPVCRYCLRVGHIDYWCPDQAKDRAQSGQNHLNDEGHRPFGVDGVTSSVRTPAQPAMNPNQQ